MTPAEYDAIAARAEAATEGPWVSEDDGGDTITVGAMTYLDDPGFFKSTDLIMENDLVDDPDGPAEDQVDDRQRCADAEFIAASRTDIPALLAALRERDTTIAQLQEQLTVAREECRYADLDAKIDRDTANRAQKALAATLDAVQHCDTTCTVAERVTAILDPEEPATT